MKRLFGFMLLLLAAMLMTVPALAGEAGVQTGGWNATLGLIVGFIIGSGVMFLFMRRNPHIIANIKKELGEVKKDRSKVIVNYLNFKHHLEKEIADFPSDLKERIKSLLNKNDD